MYFSSAWPTALKLILFVCEYVCENICGTVSYASICREKDHIISSHGCNGPPKYIIDASNARARACLRFSERNAHIHTHIATHKTQTHIPSVLSFSPYGAFSVNPRDTRCCVAATAAAAGAVVAAITGAAVDNGVAVASWPGPVRSFVGFVLIRIYHNI